MELSFLRENHFVPPPKNFHWRTLTLFFCVDKAKNNGENEHYTTIEKLSIGGILFSSHIILRKKL